MSHEIRTPLNGMIAVGELLSETSLTPAQWDLVNTIRCSGETLLTLITDILDFSRIEANKLVLSHSSFQLQGVIEAAMEIAGLKVRGWGGLLACLGQQQQGRQHIPVALLLAGTVSWDIRVACLLAVYCTGMVPGACPGLMLHHGPPC